MLTVTWFRNIGSTKSIVSKALCDKSWNFGFKVSAKCHECQEFKILKQSGHLVTIVARSFDNFSIGITIFFWNFG